MRLAGLTTGARASLILGWRKLARSPVARIATGAVLLITAVTTVGGYAAAQSFPDTDTGRKAAGIVGEPGWGGYTGLAATSVGITMLLAAGIVMSWSAGREFTDNTVVGLFAIPPRPGTIAAMKVAVAVGWIAVLSMVTAGVISLGGLLLRLPAAGALRSGATVFTTGLLLGASALPAMWVATRGRGYLPGITTTLGVVVVTNVAAGFGLGTYLPWAIPVMWATPGSGLSAWLLALPSLVSLVAAVAVYRAWQHLQLGAS